MYGGKWGKLAFFLKNDQYYSVPLYKYLFVVGISTLPFLSYFVLIVPHGLTCYACSLLYLLVITLT